MDSETGGFGPNRIKMIDAIGRYLTPLVEDSRRGERANKSMMATILREIDPDYLKEPLEEIPFSDEDQKKYDLVMSYLALESLVDSCGQCEYYFRRYPFSGLPISRKEHLQNACEMYFDRIAQIKDRLKLVINQLKKLNGQDDDRYSLIIRLYSKHYDWELRQRNAAHHNRRFEYDAIDQLGLINLLRLSNDFAWLPDQKSIYRSEAKKWVSRIRREIKNLQNVTEAVATIIFENSDFLGANIGNPEPEN